MRNRVEFDEPLSDQIVQAPRRSYQNIHAATKRLDLRALFHTAENRQMLQTDIFSVIRKTVADLHGQLPGRGQDQGPDRPHSVFPTMIPPPPVAARHVGRLCLHPTAQMLQDRNGERRRLTRPGLGDAQHIAPIERHGNTLLLNGRRSQVSFFTDRLQNRVGNFQFVKCHNHRIIPSYDGVFICRGGIRCGSGKTEARKFPVPGRNRSHAHLVPRQRNLPEPR